MDSNDGERRVKYPFGKFAVCWSALMSGFSILLSLLLLREAAHLTLYFVSTSVLTVIIFKLKIHVFLKEDSSERSGGIQKWKIILLVLSLLAVFSVSVGLLTILDPASWFVALNSLVCSLSLSEVGLFFYCRR